MPSEYIAYPCPHCGSDRALVTPNGPRNELRCASCNRYIKFISKAELEPRTANA